MYAPINFADKLAKFSDRWSPKIIAQMNEYHFKLVKIRGEFIWHAHDDTDEVFIVLEGTLTIHFRDGAVDLCVPERCSLFPGEWSTSRSLRTSAG
jgi:mannose-6-phosphate isomerase-like protein (cupin superfamily)